MTTHKYSYFEFNYLRAILIGSCVYKWNILQYVSQYHCLCLNKRKDNGDICGQCHHIVSNKCTILWKYKWLKMMCKLSLWTQSAPPKNRYDTNNQLKGFYYNISMGHGKTNSKSKAAQKVNTWKERHTGVSYNASN